MERISRFRGFVMMVLLVILLSVYGVRMYALQMKGAGNVVTNSSMNTSYTTVKGARGNILDRNGNTLVSNRASYNLVFNNFVIMSSENPNEALMRLVSLCEERGIEYIDHFPVSMERPYEYIHDEFSSSWKGYFQSYLADMSIDSDISAPRLVKKLRSYCKIPKEWSDDLARRVLGLRYELALRADITNLPSYIFIEDVSNEDLNAIMELSTPGLTAEASTVREYNTKCAAHVLGAMTKIGPDEWPEYREKGYSMDAEIGDSGFERAFEEYLHGTDGELVRTVDKNGAIIKEYYRVKPKAGSNVEVTLDQNLQIAAEEALAYYVENLRLTSVDQNGNPLPGHDAKGAAVVAIEVATGDVLACASYPTYDLSRFRESDYFNELNSDPLAPMFNRALQSSQAPGSVYKMVTATAGMENGVISRYSQILTQGRYTKYDGEYGPVCLLFANRGTTHGLIDVTQALQYSCNWFFYEVGDRLSNEALDATAKSFGLGEHTGVELSESIGQRANPETKEKLYEGVSGHWYAGDQLLAAIGQSENRFTPMQLASYTATIANKGTRYACTFLNRVVSSDYSTLIKENTPQVLSTVKMSKDTQEALFEGMNKVTKSDEGGVGTAVYYYTSGPDAWYRSHPDIQVCAKTGTAEHGSGGSPNGSFVCFAPMEDPQIAIAVYIEKAGQGGYGANVANAIMEVYFSGDVASDLVTNENRVS